VFIALELVDKDMDARDEAGRQADDANWPTVQIAVCEGKGKNVRLTSDEAPKVLFQARSRDPYPDGLILEIPANRLPKSDKPYIILPMTSEPGVVHKFAISAYTNHYAELSKVNPEPCNLCPGDCKTCPMVQIMQRIDALENRFNNHLSFLEQIA